MKKKRIVLNLGVFRTIIEFEMYFHINKDLLVS